MRVLDRDPCAADGQNTSRDQSNLERIDWLAGLKIRIVALSFVELKMDKTVSLKLSSPR